jgi:excisionase family DNA binding protein
MQDQTPFPEIMTSKQAAEYLQVSRETVYRYIRQGKLIASRLGISYKVPKRNLDLLLWERRRKQMSLRQYTPEEVEAFLREDVLDAVAAELARTGSIVAATAGIFKSDVPALSAEEERRMAEQVIAEDVMERSGGRK